MPLVAGGVSVPDVSGFRRGRNAGSDARAQTLRLEPAADGAVRRG